MSEEIVKTENLVVEKPASLMSNVITEEMVEENWQKYKKLLLSTKREGIESLIKYLEEKTDMRKAPASSKYHRNTYGGLVDHSIRVFENLNKLNNQFKKRYNRKTMIITGLLHDLCKANYYEVGKQWDKKYKDETNKWREELVYKVKEQLPLGHGEKSVIIASRFIGLTAAEMCAIRWHMSAFDPGIHFYYPSGSPFRQAMEEHPLTKMTIIADLSAEFYESMYPVESVIQ